MRDTRNYIFIFAICDWQEQVKKMFDFSISHRIAFDFEAIRQANDDVGRLQQAANANLRLFICSRFFSFLSLIPCVCAFYFFANVFDSVPFSPVVKHFDSVSDVAGRQSSVAAALNCSQYTTKMQTTFFFG